VGNSVPILKHSHIQNNVSNKRIVGSSWSFTILNLNCVGKTANSCISGGLIIIIIIIIIPMLTGASFASTSEVWTSAIFEWLKVRD
jgi:hypothetical protein